MKVFSGNGASPAFEASIKEIKGNPVAWRVVLGEWAGKDAAPWQEDADKLKTICDLIGVALGQEEGEVRLISLPTGSLMVLMEQASVERYVTVIQSMATLMADDGKPRPEQVKAFDLSEDWGAFIGLCKEIYQQLKGKGDAEKQALLKRLDKHMADAKLAFAARPKASHGMRLLFVEDDPSTRQMVSQLLGAQDLSLKFAANGAEAIAAYCERPPHIVFLDINLPDITGLEILEMINRHDKDAHTVMLTSNASEAGVTFAKEHGVKGYVVKPFSWQKIKACLDRYTG